ncbi:MAG: SoxR reducing system RseC family protein [Candidatus Cloacimonetes bacterium]|jgi:positive regulator of sigma E activity|nr:SoxR reducing system RseC family protein [Candidatus Cloacimonadota bacterium]MDD4156690.1 SoxR reducing system RseC family protein [Candidatus Cloacimonadota bacterium]
MNNINDCNEVKTDDNDLMLGKVKEVMSNKIVVQRLNIDSCDSCSMHGICGIKNQVDMVFDTKDEFQVGDTVEIIVNSKAKIFSAFIIFVFPILMMIMFYIVSFYLLNLVEGISILISIISLVCSALIVKFIDKRFEKKNQIKIIKKDVQ